MCQKAKCIMYFAFGHKLGVSRGSLQGLWGFLGGAWDVCGLLRWSFWSVWGIPWWSQGVPKSKEHALLAFGRSLLAPGGFSRGSSAILVESFGRLSVHSSLKKVLLSLILDYCFYDHVSTLVYNERKPCTSGACQDSPRALCYLVTLVCFALRGCWLVV